MKFLLNLFDRYIKPVIEIRPGERLKTALMFFYFFLIIALNWMLKPVQKSLYIAAFGAEKLKFANIAEGVFLIFIVSVYIYVAKRATRKTFYYGVILFFIASFVLFWVLFRLKVQYLPAFFFLWQASFIITMTTAFWTLANDIFDTLEAKRLFGVMISGGSLGGFAGSFITSSVLRWIQTEDILLIAAGLLVICLLVVRKLLNVIPDDPNEKAYQSVPKQKPVKRERTALSLFFTTPYLLVLAGVVMMAKMSSTIVDNQFSAVVANTMQDKDAMTAFFGKFGMGVNLLTFFMQFFATGIFLRYLGVTFSLWFLPIGLALLSVLTAVNPILLTAVIYRIFDLSGNYSVQQATKEVFYLPVSSVLRRRVKPIIDMLCYRASKSFAGLFMWIFGSIFAIPVIHFGWLVLMLIPFWLLLVWQMKKCYEKALREQAEIAEKEKLADYI